MDYKYIEQLMERYWNAETSYEEECTLRSFFSQEHIPAELEQWRPLFIDEVSNQTLGDDFDARILEMVSSEPERVVARSISLTDRLRPLFKAAAVIAILLTIGGALQAPWDSSWTQPTEYAGFVPDTVDVTIPVQAENVIDKSADSVSVVPLDHSTD